METLQLQLLSAFIASYENMLSVGLEKDSPAHIMQTYLQFSESLLIQIYLESMKQLSHQLI